MPEAKIFYREYIDSTGPEGILQPSLRTNGYVGLEALKVELGKVPDIDPNDRKRVIELVDESAIQVRKILVNGGIIPMKGPIYSPENPGDIKAKTNELSQGCKDYVDENYFVSANYSWLKKQGLKMPEWEKNGKPLVHSQTTVGIYSPEVNKRLFEDETSKPMYDLEVLTRSNRKLFDIYFEKCLERVIRELHFREGFISVISPDSLLYNVLFEDAQKAQGRLNGISWSGDYLNSEGKIILSSNHQ